MALKLSKIAEHKGRNTLTFLIKGSDVVFANTIRRLILEEVPTLAVEEVYFKDNSSALYNEMLALRLGLCPIKTDLSTYELPKSQADIDEKSARCTLQLTLKTSANGYILAEQAVSADPKCTFAQPKMPLVKLLPKQKIDLKMLAVLGQGKDHTKWSPGMAVFRHEHKLKVGKVQNPDLLKENCTDGVFTIKDSKVTVNEKNVAASKLLEYYAELDEGISVEQTGNIIFTVESWGQLKNKEMLTQSGIILKQKAEELVTLL